jgi:hypothetical protein
MARVHTPEGVGHNLKKPRRLSPALSSKPKASSR